MKVLQFIIFFIFFSSLYYAMNYLVVNRLWIYSGYDRPAWLQFLIIGVVVFFPLAMILSRTLPYSIFLKYLYTIAVTLMGIVSIAIGVIVITEALRLLLPSGIDVFLKRAALLAVFSLSLYALYNGRQIEVQEIRLGMPKLTEKLRIVQLSDVHLGMIINEKYARRITGIVNALDHDLIVITGDLFDGSRPPARRCVEGFAELKKPVYFASGNHDMYEGLDNVATALKGSNIRYLKNESVIIKGIELIGIDNPTEEFRKSPHLPEHLPSSPELPSVLLFHPPSHFEFAIESGIDLQLSGHTHYGQIWPFNYLVRMAFPKGFGVYEGGGMKLYTSPGTGTWGPPMRLGSKNQITLIELNPEK